MIVQDIITRVQRLFGDEFAVQVTDADIIRWINDAQREIVMHNESVLQIIATQNVVQGQNEYSFPADLYILRSVRIKMPNSESYHTVHHRNLQEFDRQADGWDGTLFGEGIPYIYTTYNRDIFIFPAPDQNSTDGLKLLYSQRPVDVTDSLDTLPLPDEYFNAVLKYCMIQANTLDEDYDAGTIHQAQFISDIRQLSFQRGYGVQDTYPSITPRLEDAW